MRCIRILLLVLALVPGASSASATATASGLPDQAPPSGVVVGGPARAAEIVVTSEVVRKRVRADRPRQLFLVGSVTPRKGPVYIQRATTCDRRASRRTGELVCDFVFYRRVFLDRGRYQALIDAPPRLRGWVWRAKVASSVSPPWKTCTTRGSQDCRTPY